MRNESYIRHQFGQAISEFLGMLTVLVPLVLFVPILGKYADLNHTAVQASRYGAWERTIASDGVKSDAQLRTEVQRRFFSRPDVFIRTNDGVQETAAYHNALWDDHAGRRLLRRFDDIGTGTQNAATPGTAAGLVSSLTSGFLATISAFGSDGDLDLESRGLYTARVTAATGTLPTGGFAQGVDCGGQASNDVFACIQRHNVILADTWNASSPNQVASRVRGLVPMGAFEEVTSVLDLLANIPFLEEIGRFQPGYVSPDVIPGDRLGAYQL